MMLTQEQIARLEELLSWFREELFELEDDFGIEDHYAWRIYRDAEEVIDHLKEMSSAANPADQIGENPYLQAMVKIAELVNEYDALFDTEDELEDRPSWDLIDSFIDDIRNALKGVFS